MTMPPFPRADLNAIRSSAALAELRALENRWVNWQPVLRDKKWRKVPKRPNGAHADATKPITWFNFEDCADGLIKRPEFAGVGFVLDGSDDLIGLDFDHCLNDAREIESPELEDFIARLDTYTEISPSNTGLRCFLRGAMNRDSLTFRVGDVEGVAFKSKRYLTLTGLRYPNTPDSIEPRQPHLDWIAEQSARRHPNGNGAMCKRSAGDSSLHWFDALPVDRQLEELATMLDHLTDPSFAKYETWLRITFAIHHTTEGQGFHLWDAWCQKLPRYDSDENAYKWTSIRSDRDNSRTIGTIIDLAKAQGYQLPPDAGHPQLAEHDRARIEQTIDAPPPAPAPAVPLDPALIGPIGDTVLTLEPHTEADPLGILASTLTLYGNWLGRSVFVQVGADRHYPCLYTLLLGDSYVGRKGTAAALARLILRAVDPVWSENNIFHAVNSGQGILATIKSVDDADRGRGGTGDKRIAFLMTEFADLLMKTKQQSNTSLPTLRSLWDDGSADNTSVTRFTRIRNAHVSILGMVTAEELTSQLDIRELVTGTLNRFMLVSVQRSKTLPGHPPIIEPRLILPQIKNLRDNVARARKNQAAVAPVPIPLAQDALDLAVAYKAEFETPAKSWVDVASQRSYVQVLRLALIYAVSCGSLSTAALHMRAAKALVDHSRSTIRRFATGDMAAISDPIADRILMHMREDPKEALSRTGISSDIFQRHVNAEKLENAIRRLIQLGLLRQATVKDTGGRPKTVYALAHPSQQGRA